MQWGTPLLVRQANVRFGSKAVVRPSVRIPELRMSAMGGKRTFVFGNKSCSAQTTTAASEPPSSCPPTERL